MNWKHAFTSSVGKKIVVGVTGLFLILFLIVHCYINALVFLPNGRELYLNAAHFMGTNFLIRTMEIGLFVGLILHAVQALMLVGQNKKKRPVNYEIKPGNESSSWYSRSMGLLGTLILLFLVVHLYHFWIPNRYEQHLGSGEEIDLYDKMQVVFSSIGPVIVYTIGCISLAWHLAHGFWSSFHTLGLSPRKYKKLITNVGYAFAIIIPGLFIAMPWAFYLGWIG